MSSQTQLPNNPVVISAESFKSDDIRDPIESNIGFVNALFGELLKPSEISRDALLSYYVDYYLAQVMNGGFAQFVYNTRWKPEVISFVKEGLQKLGAQRHAELFAKCELHVAEQKADLASFFSSEFFGENAVRDRLNVFNNEFYALDKSENLERLNASWLKSRPGLVVVPEIELKQQIAQRAAQIPDRDVRLAKARAAEPRYMKLIRALCDANGHVLERVTAGDPTNQYCGRRILAWHFLTDKGHHFMVEADGKAMMFVGKTKQKIAELAVE
jgi:hypothetical protein